MHCASFSHVDALPGLYQRTDRKAGSVWTGMSNQPVLSAGQAIDVDELGSANEVQTHGGESHPSHAWSTSELILQAGYQQSEWQAGSSTAQEMVPQVGQCAEPQCQPGIPVAHEYERISML